MRIGFVCKGEISSRRGFEIVKIGEFRAVEVFRVGIKLKGGKRRFLRSIKKCADELRTLGITLCAAEKEFEILRQYGITVITDAERVLREKAADAALVFMHEHSIQADFIIVGGGFTDVTETAKYLLRKFRCVYVKNNSFEEIADEISEATGACVRSDAPAETVALYMCDERKFLKYNEICADISDFEIRIADELFDALPGKILAPLAEVLEISGVLRKSEIKVEYFPKEKFKINKAFT